MGCKFSDLTDERFGHLVARWPVGKTKDNHIVWLCSCDCGKLKNIRQYLLRHGRTKSCGCKKTQLHLEADRRAGRNVRSEYSDEAYRMWACAKSRARMKNLPFDLGVADIIVPEFCPILGIKLKKDGGRRKHSSPSLDRKEPKLGYVKNNIRVISWRANDLRADATLEEMQLLVKNWNVA